MWSCKLLRYRHEPLQIPALWGRKPGLARARMRPDKGQLNYLQIQLNADGLSYKETELRQPSAINQKYGACLAPFFFPLAA